MTQGCSVSLASGHLDRHCIKLTLNPSLTSRHNNPLIVVPWQGTMVTGNIMRESGIWEKQSSCFFQAKTAGTTLLRNLCFNLPRAGFNFNDGQSSAAVAAARLCPCRNRANTTKKSGTLSKLSGTVFECLRRHNQSHLHQLPMLCMYEIIGLGGGDEVHHNLIFNTCRETR